MKVLKFTTSFLLVLMCVSLAQGQTTESIALRGSQVFPEGIITLPNNDLLVGGFGDGSIQRIDSKNNVSYFSQNGENGMVIAVGFAIDKKNNRLWVANFNFKTDSGNPGSNLKVFDFTNGKLLKTIPENFVQGAFFNELAIDKNGTVFVSDTFGPQLWTANFDSKDASVFVNDGTLLKNPSADQPFGLNGLTITPDQKYLITSVMNRTVKGGGTLVRINLKNKEVKQIVIKDDAAKAAFSGSDGMFFHKRELLMVNVYSKAGAIFSAKFNSDFSKARLSIKDKFQSLYDRPTASAVRDGKLYTVNSQLNRIIDDKDGALNTPPVLPFQVIAVPLDELLDESLNEYEGR